jgi:uncharacterized protein DUF6326
MILEKKEAGTLEDIRINIKFKLSALWVSVMLCYIYGDYFGLYKPGTLDSMLAGQLGPLGPTTQGLLVGTSVLMAIPSIMVILSLVLKAKVNRLVNMIFGIIYTIVMIITIPGSWAFYIFLGAIEIILTSLIFWLAWNWPRRGHLTA